MDVRNQTDHVKYVYGFARLGKYMKEQMDKAIDKAKGKRQEDTKDAKFNT